MDIPELHDKLRMYKALRDEKDRLASELKVVNDQLDLLNGELTIFFESNDMDQHRVPEVGLFFLHHTSRPTVDDPEVCKAWLAEKGDLEMLLSFNTNKFKAYWKEKVENREETPPGVSEFIQTEVRMRKA